MHTSYSIHFPSNKCQFENFSYMKWHFDQYTENFLEQKQDLTLFVCNWVVCVIGLIKTPLARLLIGLYIKWSYLIGPEVNPFVCKQESCNLDRDVGGKDDKWFCQTSDQFIPNFCGHKTWSVVKTNHVI